MTDENVVFGTSSCPSTTKFEETGSCCYQWSSNDKVWFLKSSDCKSGHKCQTPEELELVGNFDGQFVRIACVPA